MWQKSVIDYWCRGLCEAVEAATTALAVFSVIDDHAQRLGFEHSAFVLRKALPVTRPRTQQLSSQPVAWRDRYAEARYIDIDPTVLNGARSEAPQIWRKQLFEQVPQMWEEAQAAGLRHAWTQSSLDCVGVGGVLTLSRSAEPITAQELQDKGPRMRNLVQIAHKALSRAMAQRHETPAVSLTDREKEILRWTADGKTAGQIAIGLALSVNTVNFHLKNCAAKLHAANRPSMVAHALVWQLLD